MFGKEKIINTESMVAAVVFTQKMAEVLLGQQLVLKRHAAIGEKIVSGYSDGYANRRLKIDCEFTGEDRLTHTAIAWVRMIRSGGVWRPGWYGPNSHFIKVDDMSPRGMNQPEPVRWPFVTPVEAEAFDSHILPPTENPQRFDYSRIR
jgi:hypothetical protein